MSSSFYLLSPSTPGGATPRTESALPGHVDVRDAFMARTRVAIKQRLRRTRVPQAAQPRHRRWARLDTDARRHLLAPRLGRCAPQRHEKSSDLIAPHRERHTPRSECSRLKMRQVVRAHLGSTAGVGPSLGREPPSPGRHSRKRPARLGRAGGRDEQFHRGPWCAAIRPPGPAVISSVRVNPRRRSVSTTHPGSAARHRHREHDAPPARAGQPHPGTYRRASSDNLGHLCALH